MDLNLTPRERLEAAFRRRWGDAPIIGYRRDGRGIYSMRGAGEHLYLVQNSTVATSAAPVHQPTGSAIRTMLQIECGPADPLSIVEWGVSFDGVTASNAPIECELFHNTVAATMSTALAATDVTLLNNPADTSATSAIVYGGTTHSGFATAAVTEATVAGYRLMDLQHVPPTSGYVHQWPLGREPVVPVAKFVRVRVTATATANAYIYVVWAE